MTDEKKLELLADVFDCDVEDLAEDLSLESFDKWDSMTKLSLIVLMDDEFGKQVTNEDIKSLKTVGDIIAIMQ